MIQLNPSLLYVLAFLIPLGGTLLLTPVASRIARKLQVLDRPSADKYHRVETPYLGGAAVAIGLLLVAGVVSGAEGQILVILVAALVLSVVGLLDDQRVIPWWSKLLVEIVAAGALWLVGVGAGLFNSVPLDLILTVFWVVGITNAINMLDNMDGLASGVSAIAALTFFAIAADRGGFLVASFSLAIAGASLGFLRWNFPPAKIFLGDSGTLLLGFLLAAIGLKLDLVGANGLVRSAVPILALAVPVFDAILVVLARTREKRPVYIGGTDHSSHRLAALGLSSKWIALTTYAVQALCSVIALWVLQAAWPTAVAAVVGMTMLAVVALVLALRLDEKLRQPKHADLTAADHPSRE